MDHISEKNKTPTEMFININEIHLGEFYLFYGKTYKIVSTLIGELFANTIAEFNIRSNRNVAFIINTLTEKMLLKFIKGIKENDSFRKYILEYEENENYELKEIFQEAHKAYIRKFHLEEEFKNIKTIMALFVPEKQRKEVMEKLGLYSPYKPKGKQLSPERKEIYRCVYRIEYGLKSQHGGRLSGKSDTRTAVDETIKFLQKNGDLQKKFTKKEIDAIYDGYLKSDYHKRYNKD